MLKTAKQGDHTWYWTCSKLVSVSEIMIIGGDFITTKLLNQHNI